MHIYDCFFPPIHPTTVCRLPAPLKWLVGAVIAQQLLQSAPRQTHSNSQLKYGTLVCGPTVTSTQCQFVHLKH